MMNRLIGLFFPSQKQHNVQHFIRSHYGLLVLAHRGRHRLRLWRSAWKFSLKLQLTSCAVISNSINTQQRYRDNDDIKMTLSTFGKSLIAYSYNRDSKTVFILFGSNLTLQ
jgi:hypothetical protein